MIKEGIEKEVVSRTFLCLDLAHQVVAASAGLLSGRPCPGSCLDTCIYIYIRDSQLNRPESVSLASLVRQLHRRVKRTNQIGS